MYSVAEAGKFTVDLSREESNAILTAYSRGIEQADRKELESVIAKLKDAIRGE